MKPTMRDAWRYGLTILTLWFTLLPAQAGVGPDDSGGETWQAADVGAVGVAGSTSYSSAADSFTIKASGSDIWATSDSFQFAFLPWTGDGQIIARVQSLQNTNPWAKAGIMFRESLAANSRYAFLAFTPGNGVVFQARTGTGSSAVHLSATAASAPVWVKLVRCSSRFIAYTSIDGGKWNYQGEISIGMSQFLYCGLAVTSLNNSALTTAVFDHVDLTAVRAYEESSNQISIEAEGADALVSRASHDWTSQTSRTGFSGGSYLAALPNSGGSINSGFSTGSPESVYHAFFKSAGTYYVWVRGYGATGNDDSVHAGLNRTLTAASDRMSGFNASWKWSNSTMDGPRATITVPAPGAHTFHLWMREDGFLADKILLTRSSSTTAPSGTGPAASSRTLLESDNALRFDGADDYAEIPNTASLQDVTDRSYSFSAWVRPRVAPRNVDNNTSGYMILSRPGPYNTHVAYRNDKRFSAGAVKSDGTQVPVSSAATYEPGSWYHVCLTVDDTLKKITLYVNGLQAGSTTYTGTLYDHGAMPYYLGMSNPAASDWKWLLDGDLDDVRIHNRALSASEVLVPAYNGRIKTLRADAGLVAGWHMNEGTGVTLGDFSLLGTNPANLKNGPSWIAGSSTPGVDMALKFDGNDYAQISGAGSLQNVTDRSFSISVWAKVAAPPANTNNDTSGYGIVSRQGWYTTYIGYSADQRFIAEVVKSDNTRLALLSDASAPGGWHHLCLSVDDVNKKAAFYLDGAPVSGSPLSYTGTLYDFGAVPYYLGVTDPTKADWRWFFNGFIDECRIYNRPLSAAEANAQFTSGRISAAPAESGLVGGWHFNEGTGTQSADFSGGGNPATINGALWSDGSTPNPGQTWVEVFRDDFNGTSLDLTKWKFPQWAFGNSKMLLANNGNTSPVLSGGIASFKVETYNPDAVGKMRGSLVYSVPEWPVGNGVEFECVCRNRPGIVKGIVNAFWADNWGRQNDPNNAELNDEIDLEMLTNFILDPSSPNYKKITVATHHGFYSGTTPQNISHGKYQLVAGLDQLAYNKYVIRWYRDHVEWYANGVKMYDTRDDGIPAADIPDSPMQVLFEAWAAAPGNWDEAADAALQPTTDPAQNKVYYMDVDYVVVRQLL